MGIYVCINASETFVMDAKENYKIDGFRVEFCHELIRFGFSSTINFLVFEQKFSINNFSIYLFLAIAHS